MTQLGRRDFAERKEAGIDRLRARAAKASQESQARLGAADRISDRFYGGQPILVGHHSEGKARRDQERIHQNMAKGIEASKKASRLLSRADAAEDSRAISSDDPEAVTKLRARLEKFEANRENIKRLNALHRKGGWAAVAGELGVELAAIPESRRSEKPFADYKLTNLGAEIRRTKQRIEALEKLAAAPERAPVMVGDIEVREEDNRVQLLFLGKPSEEVRKVLKSNGFKWAPSVGAWQRMAKAGIFEFAVGVAGRCVEGSTG